ncbi:hypothetical protein [Rhizobium sp. BK491]|uniref:hypothetical protein n=1 Tax=Rhizobium sp. BK491 TaxID=2587009 RepID=UPI001620BE18|nr:hypothetical protein [Rhizobium sp. BK491]MBB3572047.1 hypothetical protein [Rhizobium sp. BK491]
MAASTVEMKADLELIAKRLSRGAKPKHPPQRSPTADELAEFKRALYMRLQPVPWASNLSLWNGNMRGAKAADAGVIDIEGFVPYFQGGIDILLSLSI